MKRDICDKLYSIAIKQYTNEEKTNDLMTMVWYSIYDVLNKQGKEKAEQYAKNIKNVKEISK